MFIDLNLAIAIRRMLAVLAVFGWVAAGTVHAAAPTDETPPPEPEEVNLTTKDGVELHVSYYPGSEGKKTATVILLHGHTGPVGPGSGRDCAGLASALQSANHAVLVPDLRGYGRSVVQNIDGRVERLDANRFRRDDIEAMVKFDLEAVKKHIVFLHNQGDLNANLICVVGFDVGSVVALNWTQLDWNMQSLPNLKQGQDVRAMVLVTPLQSFRGYPIREALADKAVRSDVSAMVVFGNRDPSAATSGRRLFRTLERSHRPIPVDPEERLEKQDLFLFELQTSLQGTKLLTVREFKLNQLIVDFVDRRVVQHRDRYPWRSRKIQ